MYWAIVIAPAQTFNILKSLSNTLHRAATALQSEILALRRHPEGRRTNPGFKKLGEGQRRRNEDRSIGWLGPFTSSPGALSAAVAQPDAPREGHGFYFFRHSRRTVVFPDPLPHSLLIIFGWQRHCRLREIGGRSVNPEQNTTTPELSWRKACCPMLIQPESSLFDPGNTTFVGRGLGHRRL